MLLLSQVSKRYGNTVALAPTDLQVPAGETLVLIGPSGCGKSTLLRLIIGLVKSDSGAITFAGTILTPENIFQIRQQTGYVIQEGGLFPRLRVRENVLVMAGHLHRDAVHQDRHARGRDGRASAATRADPTRCLAGGRRPRLRACARTRAPRRQAQQHPAR